MSTLELRSFKEQNVKSRLDMNFSFPLETTKASASRIARVIFDYLYEGEFNSDLFGDDVRKIRGFSQIIGEKPLVDDSELTDKDVCIRAMIGTYLVSTQNYGPSYMQEYANMQYRKIH